MDLTQFQRAPPAADGRSRGAAPGLGEPLLPNAAPVWRVSPVAGPALPTTGRVAPPRAQDGVVAPLEGAPDAAAAGFEVPFPQDRMGRFLLGFLQAMLPVGVNDLQAPRVAGLVRQLRQRFKLVLVCSLLTAPIAVWLLIRGVTTYMATGDAPGCHGPLRIWLLGFLMLQLAWPICMPSLTLLLLGWCLGALVLYQEPRECEGIHSFLIEASVLQSVQAALLLVAGVAALTARSLVQRLGDLLNQNGTDPDVLSKIKVLQASEVPPEEDCIICLSREEGETVPWRQLSCMHRFHEKCLLEWLGKARRCPVCRLDLHEAYRPDPSPVPSPASAGGAAAQGQAPPAPTSGSRGQPGEAAAAWAGAAALAASVPPGAPAAAPPEVLV